jgi:hypothetical protein
MQLRRGLREVSEIGDFDEAAQLLQVHVFTLSGQVKLCIGVIDRIFLAWKHAHS